MPEQPKSQTKSIWEIALDELVTLDNKLNEEILRIYKRGKDVSRDYPESCLVVNPYNPENPEEQEVSAAELIWHTKQIVRIHEDLVKEEEEHIDEIEVFLSDVRNTGNTDLSWMEPEALPFLQDRVTAAVETLNSVIGAQALFACTTANPFEIIHTLLKTGWDNHGRKQLAERLYNNACPQDEDDEDDETDDYESRPNW
jgi:hypothetical protein